METTLRDQLISGLVRFGYNHALLDIQTWMASKDYTFTKPELMDKLLSLMGDGKSHVVGIASLQNKFGEILEQVTLNTVN